jgi:myosin heavy subunit
MKVSSLALSNTEVVLRVSSCSNTGPPATNNSPYPLIIFRLADYLRRTKAAITLQTTWRCHRARGHYLRLRHATLVIQSQYRGRQARLLKMRLLYEAKAMVIQRAVRAFLGRRSFIAIRQKVILLQCCVRRLIAQREFKKLKVGFFRVLFCTDIK